MAEKIITGAVTKEYEEGWERIFGEKDKRKKEIEEERKIHKAARWHVYREGIGSDDQ